MRLAKGKKRFAMFAIAEILFFFVNVTNALEVRFRPLVLFVVI